MNTQTIQIGCCGAYCKTCRASKTGSHCRGCKLGYDTGERDIKRAKCRIKLCCLEKGFQTCADCSGFSSCEKLRNRFKGYQLRKYLEILGFIRKNGYGRFAEVAGEWNGPYGKLNR